MRGVRACPSRMLYQSKRLSRKRRNGRGRPPNRFFGDEFFVSPAGEIAGVHEVKIEYAPSPASEYLADVTSFDAFIDYERDTGERAFIAVETKLTDSFSPDTTSLRIGAG